MLKSLIISAPDEELHLREESEDDYIEYKLRLDTKNKFGLKKLLSQMNYRFDIGKIMLGKREAHYVLGIHDDGSLGKLTEIEIDETIRIFTKVVNDNGATVVNIDKINYCSPKGYSSNLAYIIVQKIETFKIKEINVAFVGASQHGKTTTVSHLVYGQFDDSNGYARKLVFKHEHEKLSGVTSSIKKEIIGLNKGNIVNYGIGITTGWQDIVEMSDKIINLIDLPGNLKYFRSTFFGLSTYDINGLIIVVDPKKLNNGLPERSINEFKFYKLFAETFNIPYIFLIIDDEEVKPVINEFNVGLNVVYFSNLSSYGSKEMAIFLDSINANTSIEHQQDESTDLLFYIMETYRVPDVGTIFSGTMKCGSISLGDDVYLTNGINYYQTKVKSIQRKQIDSKTLYVAENGAIQLEFDTSIIPEVNKHMIITTKKHEMYDNFIFNLLNLECEYIIKNGQRCVMFVDNVIVNVYASIDSESGITILQTEQKIIVPSIGTKNCIAFIKLDYGVLFGYLHLTNTKSV